MTGILGAGDSIINADRSWAYWLAQATGEPLERVSVGGQTSTEALPQLDRIAGRYGLACLTIGTNDALRDWSPDRFEQNVKTLIAGLREHAEQVAVQTVPESLAYFPGVGREIRRRVVVANEILRAADAVIVEGADLRGRATMSPDRIHPNVAGQVLMADRAAEALDIEPRPSSLFDGAPDFRPLDYPVMVAKRLPKRLVKRALGRLY